MADKKISQLTSLAQGDIATTTDVLAIVDTSATETKKATPAAIVGAAAAAGLTNVDINSGAIDGTTIGANSAAAGTFTTLTGSTKTVSPFFDAVGSAGGQLRNASGTSQLAWGAGGGSNLSLEVATNINPANANVSLAPTGTGTVTINPATAGTMNNVAIGGTTAAAGSFTTLTTSSTVTLNGGTANGVLYLNGSKVATSGSALTFDGTNLGLGAASRPSRLTLEGTNGAVGSQIQLVGTGVLSGYIGPSADGLNFGTDSGGLIFRTGVTGNGSVTTGSEGMRLTSTTFYTASGINVGIGTSSPGSKLDVRGNATFTGNATARQTADFTNTGGQLYVGAESSAGGAVFTGSSAYAGILGTNTNTALQLATNGAVRATLDSSGNLGLGVTPNVWGSDYRAVELTAGAISSTTAGNTFMQVSNAAHYNGTQWIYKYTSIAPALYQQTSGQHRFLTAASGTAGTAISFTQAMTLSATGGLTVGSTTDPGAGKILAEGSSASHYVASSKAGITTTYLITDASGANVQVDGAWPIRFTTNSTERGRFTAGGYFKASNTGTYFGSTNPYHELRTDGAAGDWIARLSSTTATSANAYGLVIEYTASSPNGTINSFLYCLDSAAQRAAIRSNGGLANYQSNNVDLSDARTKKDITPAASMWDKIGALEIVTYKYNDQTHDDVNVGVIAQQVESVEPVWVDNDGWGDETPEDGVPLKTVYTKDITFAAIKALQEAMARIESLEAKVAALEAK